MNGDAVDDDASYAILLQISGNLRHRIEKLGSETDADRLIASQTKLRRLADRMPFDEHFDGPRKMHDRPALG